MTTKCETDIHFKTPPKRSPLRRRRNAEHHFARKMHQHGGVYVAYGALDGASTAYGMLRYGASLWFNDTDRFPTERIHDWLITPTGIATAALESITFITYSLLGNLFDDGDKNAFKRFIAISWPYVRDLKVLKYAYNGIRNTIQAYGTVLGQNLRYLVLPLGLTLGILSALNRFCLRKFVIEPRKSLMKKNAFLLMEVQSLGKCCFHTRSILPENRANYKNSYILIKNKLYYVNFDEAIEEVQFTGDQFKNFLKDFQKLNPQRYDQIGFSDQTIQNLIEANGSKPPDIYGNFRKRIGRQSPQLWGAALAGVAYGGFVDSMYLFMGIFGLAVLASPALLAMVVFSTIFSVTCIATRIYEEYDFQRKLVEAQAKVELAILSKEAEALFTRLTRLSNPLQTPFDPNDEEKTKALELEQLTLSKQFVDKLEAYQKQQAHLNAQVTLGYGSAILAGLKSGLMAYSAIASIMFSVAMLCALFSTAFPPAFLITCVVAGMACLIGFLTHSLVVNHQHLQRQKALQSIQQAEPALKPIPAIVKLFKENRAAVKNLKPSELKEALLQGMLFDPSPQNLAQEFSELMRGMSCLSKAQKVSEFMFNPLQELDKNGHYQDTPGMLAIVGISVVFYTTIFGARGYVKGFGKPSISDVGSGKMPFMEDVYFPDEDSTPSGDASPQTFNNASSVVVNQPSVINRHAFFDNPQPPRPLRRSSSIDSFFSSRQKAPIARSLSAGDLITADNTAVSVQFGV